MGNVCSQDRPTLSEKKGAAASLVLVPWLRCREFSHDFAQRSLSQREPCVLSLFDETFHRWVFRKVETDRREKHLARFDLF